MTNIEFHPYCVLFPSCTEEELKTLAEDIFENGLLEPVVLLDGKILDGRNRYLACLRSNTMLKTVEFTGDDPLAFVLSKNLHRRHLTESQRALIAASIANIRRGYNQREQSANLPITQRKSLSTKWVTAKNNHKNTSRMRNTDALNLSQRETAKIMNVSELFSTESAVHSIFTDIFKNTKDRNKILIFCADVAQAILFQRELQRITSNVGLITGETPAHERAELLARFQDKPTGLLKQTEPLHWLVNVSVLTTGFDAPNIDCVVLARPTMSPGLFVQMCGRLLRNAPNKTDGLVLDYGGNIQRHGTIDAVSLKTKNSGNGEAPIRECPQCHNVLHISLSRCAECGYVFPMPEPQSKLDPTASKEGILSGQTTETEYEVLNVTYSKHFKKNGTPDDPPTLRIDYEIGINTFVQKWVCPEHKGWAWSNKFVPWWKERTNIKPPTTVDEALADANSLAVPKRITVIETAGQRFAEVIEHDFTVKPQVCGDCGFFFHGDCPYQTGLFGEEPACKNFVSKDVIDQGEEDIPF